MLASNFNISETQIHVWNRKEEVCVYLKQNGVKSIVDSLTFGVKDFETQNTLDLIFLNFKDKSCFNLV